MPIGMLFWFNSGRQIRYTQCRTHRMDKNWAGKFNYLTIYCP